MIKSDKQGSTKQVKTIHIFDTLLGQTIDNRFKVG